MKFLTFKPSSEEEARIGVLVDDKIVDVVNAASAAGASAGALASLGPVHSLKALLELGDEGLRAAKSVVDAVRSGSAAESGATGKLFYDPGHVTFLPPVPDVGKFICIGANYRSHVEELMEKGLIKQWPPKPVGFVKFSSVLVGHDASVVRPEGITTMDYEPEMVLVIKKRAYKVPADDSAMDYVAGLTCLNDLSARGEQAVDVKHGTRIMRAKNLPGFGPVGPYLVTLDEVGDPNNLRLQCIVNGEVRIDVSTQELMFKIPEIISHFSEHMLLEPGDCLTTGAPGGVAVSQSNPDDFYLKPGDTVEVDLEKVGRLRTHVIGGS